MIPEHNFLNVLEKEALYLYYLGFFYSVLLCSLLLVLSWMVHHTNSKFFGYSLPCWCRWSIFFSSLRLWVTLEIGAWNSTRYLIKLHYNLFSHIYIYISWICFNPLCPFNLVYFSAGFQSHHWLSYIYFNLLNAIYWKCWTTTTMNLAKTKCLLLWDHTQKVGQIKWYGVPQGKMLLKDSHCSKK